MIEIISQPWPWYVSGPLISLVMFLMLYFGKSFGVSSNLRTMCSIAGAGKAAEFFRFDWKANIWNLVFIFGALIGGFIARQYLTLDPAVAISNQTIVDLGALGIANAGNDFAPTTLFSWESLTTIRGFVVLVIGGVLIGFGTRYAGGCTSGHAISGLSNLQLPSLIAVVGFFIGGLVMTHLLLPFILSL
jgi:uncharacterized membrane protein YedE/YeeE